MDDIAASRAKACRTCAKAKVRCEPETSGICKRCRRLNKECALQPAKTYRRRDPSTNLQVVALEQKLDRMVSMLSASHRSSPHDRSDEPSREPRFVPADEITVVPNFEEGAKLMEFYMNQMVLLFPFVVIPAGTTPETLYQEKPFLYRTITMVACKNGPRQREMAQSGRKYLAEHIVTNVENSLDLLQGLLVHVAWHHVYLQSIAQIDMLVHLALGQLTSLELNQPQNSRQPMNFLRELGANNNQSSRTLEERRVYLACYYMTSLLSSCLRSIEPVRWTNYTDECCRAIEEAAEYSSDNFLVHLVRLFRFADKIDSTILSNDLHGGSLSLPIRLSVRWFQAELQSLKASFPPESPQSAMLLLHYHTVEILLYRISIIGELSDAYEDQFLTQLDFLLACLKSTKSFFNSLYSLPTGLFPMIPYTVWAQFGHSIVVLSRLSLYRNDHGGWDHEYVRNTIDYYETCDDLVRKLQEAQPLYEKEQGQDQQGMLEVFSKVYSRVNLMKDSHRRRQEAVQPSALPLDPALDPQFMLPMSFDEIFSYSQMGGFFN